jgi:hypothetical protein
MTPHTLRFLPGRATPSNMTEVRLRFIEPTATSVERWTVACTDDLDFANSDSVYVFVSILARVMETYLVGESLTPPRYY